MFDSPPPAIAPAIQRQIDVIAHERIGSTLSLIDNGRTAIVSGRPESIIKIAQSVKTELGITTAEVEKSPIYIDTPFNKRKETQNCLRMIRSLMDGALRRAQEPLLLSTAVTQARTDLIEDIRVDFRETVRNITTINALLPKKAA